MEMKMLGVKLQDKIMERTNIFDIIEYTLKQKKRWAGHIARMTDSRWTKTLHRVATKEREEIRRTTKQKMVRRHNKEGRATWNRKATDRRQWKTLMEGYILQWIDKA